MASIKQKIEKLRAELENIIKTGKGEGICIDNRIYELSTNIDDLINIYIKEQQKMIVPDEYDMSEKKK